MGFEDGSLVAVTSNLNTSLQEATEEQLQVLLITLENMVLVCTDSLHDH